MHYERWGLHPASLIAVPATEAAGLRLVRDLLDAGWKPEDLSFGLELDPGDPEETELPPVLTGAQLAALARVPAQTDRPGGRVHTLPFQDPVLLSPL